MGASEQAFAEGDVTWITLVQLLLVSGSVVFLLFKDMRLFLGNVVLRGLKVQLLLI